MYHAAGLGGRGGSSYIDSVILRDRDADEPWTSASDGALEERRFYCQNWRADVVAVTRSDGAPWEFVRYSAYGEPTVYPVADVNRDGVVNLDDLTAFGMGTTTGDFAATPDGEPDLDFDGDIGSSVDIELFMDSYDANTGQSGKGRASSAETGNRKGYAGYEWDHVITMSHVRHRVYWAEIGRWTRRDPLGYVDTPSLYAFCRHSPISRTDESGLYSDKIGEFYACREKCGLFRCIRAVLIGMDAKDAALKKYPGESQGDSRADAWRHCVWNCNMTIKLGFNCAKIVGDNHERGRMGPADQMDLHNNAIGRAIGMRGQNCSDGCTEANDNGQLITTPPTKAAPNGPGIDYDYNYKGYGCLWG